MPYLYSGVEADADDVPAVLRIGCSHPSRYETTAFADPAEVWRCDACGADWFRLREGWMGRVRYA